MTIYNQFSSFLTKGMGMLDSESVHDIKQFVTSLQNNDGGFSNRAGNSDLYYSLFAHFILKSTVEKSYQEKLKQFVLEKSSRKDIFFVDRCCMAILYKELNKNRFGELRYLFPVLKYLTFKIYGGPLVYKYFLLFLTIDAYGLDNRAGKWMARRFYQNEVTSQGMPCPALAAQIVFKTQMGVDVKSDCNLLASYFDEQSGFKISPEADVADLLSTSVALFALKTSGVNIALYAPACLRFIESNFSEGAFLSGDGDEYRDTEYTFYGLLALGTLA